MPYNVQILPQALKQLNKIASAEQPTILEAINALADNPRPFGCKKLKGSENYRIRVGDYRVIYDVADDLLLVLVLRIGHRKDIYD